MVQKGDLGSPHMGLFIRLTVRLPRCHRDSGSVVICQPPHALRSVSLSTSLSSFVHGLELEAPAPPLHPPPLRKQGHLITTCLFSSLTSVATLLISPLLVAILPLYLSGPRAKLLPTANFVPLGLGSHPFQPSHRGLLCFRPLTVF